MALLILRESNDAARYADRHPSTPRHPRFATPRSGHIATPRPNSSRAWQWGNITMPHLGNTLARYPDSTQTPRLSNTLALHLGNTLALHRVNPASCQIRPRSASGPQHPSTASGDLPGTQKQKIGSDCNFFAIADCRVAPKRGSQPQNAAKTAVFGPGGAERSPQSQKSCKDTEFFVFAMGSTAATGQIPRKTRGISWPATQNQKQKGARYADASEKNNLAGIYASLAPYCS